MKVIVICGPTAIGKTNLAIRLAQKYNGEIINGDSMQVYKMMNIGTAKATAAEVKSAPHHLLDFKNLDETFSVAEFQLLVREKIADITTRNHLPILVGGTGLYLKAALFDYQFPQEENKKILHDENLNYEELYHLLETLDPAGAKKIHPNNHKRILRHLENIKMKELLGDEPFKKGNQPLYNSLFIGLTAERKEVYQRINQRVEQMFIDGLEKEAAAVLSYPNISLSAKQAIGYKEFIPYFENQITLEDVKETIKKNTRRYAKRQYTWFNNQLDVAWFNLEEENYLHSIDTKVEAFLDE